MKRLVRWLAVLVFLGALAAIMSTADSCLLSLGSLVARDLLDRPGTADETTRIGKILAGLILLVITLLAVPSLPTATR